LHNPESKWKPYLDVYPKIANNFPMFYNEYEKSLLKGTPMIDHIHTELEQLKEEYQRIILAVPEFKMFGQDEYIKNKVLVISRIFFVKINDVTERIMVPLAGKINNEFFIGIDMFNHHYDKVGQTYWQYSNTEEAFLVKTQKQVAKGDAVIKLIKLIFIYDRSVKITEQSLIIDFYFIMDF